MGSELPKLDKKIALLIQSSLLMKLSMVFNVCLDFIFLKLSNNVLIKILSVDVPWSEFNGTLLHALLIQSKYVLHLLQKESFSLAICFCFGHGPQLVRFVLVGSFFKPALLPLGLICDILHLESHVQLPLLEWRAAVVVGSAKPTLR